MVDPRFPVQQSVNNGTPSQSDQSPLFHAIFGTAVAALIGIVVVAAPGLFRRALTHSTTDLIRSQDGRSQSNFTPTQGDINSVLNNIRPQNVQYDPTMLYYYAGVGHAYAESLGDVAVPPRQSLVPVIPRTAEQQQQLSAFDQGRMDFGR